MDGGPGRKVRNVHPVMTEAVVQRVLAARAAGVGVPPQLALQAGRVVDVAAGQGDEPVEARLLVVGAGRRGCAGRYRNHLAAEAPRRRRVGRGLIVAEDKDLERLADGPPVIVQHAQPAVSGRIRGVVGGRNRVPGWFVALGRRPTELELARVLSQCLLDSLHRSSGGLVYRGSFCAQHAHW